MGCLFLSGLMILQTTFKSLMESKLLGGLEKKKEAIYGTIILFTRGLVWKVGKDNFVFPFRFF
jgi:hypothetical protein